MVKWCYDIRLPEGVVLFATIQKTVEALAKSWHVRQLTAEKGSDGELSLEKKMRFEENKCFRMLNTIIEQ